MKIHTYFIISNKFVYELMNEHFFLMHNNNNMYISIKYHRKYKT